jgi:glucosylglycerate synthase
MKFAIITPSLNEADSIGHVTQVLDQGINQYLSGHEFLIVNADGPSTDGTKEVFLSTTTKTQKEYLDCSHQPVIGKGTNIFSALEYCIDQYDGFVLIDADLVSIDQSWIKAFLEPLVSNEAHFVSPIYKRNRYEGNTTNHFSSPLIKILARSHISQPIAGDFAFSKEVAKALLTKPRKISDHQYGIDTLISWTASLGNYSTKEITLDKKIHKPSFGKIVPMFSQVCETTVSLISVNRQTIIERLLKGNFEISTANCVADDFVAKPDDKKINSLKDFIRDERELIDTSHFPAKYQKYLNKDSLNEDEWSDLLAGVIANLLKGDGNVASLQKTSISLLSLLYLMRVIGYFYQIESLSSNEIHLLLQAQTNLIKNKIEINLSK